MRTIGAAEEALELMVKPPPEPHRLRQALSEHSVWEQRVAEARIEIDCTRLLCLKAADLMDKAGNKAAKAEIAMIKVKAPNMALRSSTMPSRRMAAPGVSQDTSLAHSWAGIRTLRLADGPDEVHNRAIALMEYGKHPPIDPQVP
jgi:acyl-CoA dehydrogenase